MSQPLSGARRHTFGAIAAVVAAALLLSACAPAGDSGQDPDAATTLTVPINRQPATFDPINLSEGNDAYIWTSIYDTLIAIGPDGEYEPRAAAEWSYSDDALTLDITLRDDLVFSDGTPATADDLKATIEYQRDTPGPGQFQFEAIEDVTVNSDTSLTLTLSQPDPALLRRLSGRVGIIAKADEMKEEAYGLAPIGSGPYTLDTEATTAGSTYVLKKRDDHWNADAYAFETVSFRVIEDSTASENALRAGEVDIAPNIQPSSRDGLDGLGITVTEIEDTTQSFIIIADRDGQMQPALADVRVRQAINMALDREAIVKAALQGVGTPSQQVFYSTYPAFDEALNGTYEYDVDGAKQLLADAGYPDGFTVAMPSTVYTTTLEPVITQALADIGITADWQAIPAQDTVSAVTSGTFPLIVWFDGNIDDATIASGHYAADGFLNPLHTVDPELTALLDEAKATVDPEQAEAVYRKINEWGVENAWHAPIAKGNQLAASREGYAYVGTKYQLYSTLDQFGVAD